MWCIIPAAGKGTRISAASRGLPKCLVEVAGEPLLHRLLADVQQAASGICIVVPPRNDGGFAIAQSLDSLDLDVPVHTVVQTHRTGVADAVLQCREIVEGPFAVVMGDVYYDLPIVRHIVALRHGPPPAVLVEPVTGPSSDPAGVVAVEDGQVTDIEKRPLDGSESFRVAGAFAFPEGAFPIFHRARPSTGEFELEQVMRVLMKTQKVRAVVYEGWRRNVNSPEDLQAVRERGDVETGG